MPIYEYRCKACGLEFERWQRISDTNPATCEACGSEDVARLVSMSSFHLKGSGWYVTDYKGKSPGNGAATEANAKAETPATKTESSTPAAKPSESKAATAD